MQAQLKKVGITANLNSMDKNDQRARRRVGNFDFDVQEGLGSLEGDIDSFLYGSFKTGASNNYTRVSDPELDKLLDAQRGETDSAKRGQLHKQAAQRLADMSWQMGLLYPPKWDATQPYVKNYAPHFSVYGPQIFAWLEK